jgi:hypothetical protein
VPEDSVSCDQPSCCLQDTLVAVFDPASAAAGDFVLPVEGGSGDIASSSRGVPGATSADFPDKLVDIPDRRRFLPMIITLALALACGLVADRLLRTIGRGLKDLLTVTAMEILHQAAPSTLEVFSRETPLDLTRPQRTSMGCSDRERPHDYAELRRLQACWDLLSWVGDRLSLGPWGLRKNIQRI